MRVVVVGVAGAVGAGVSLGSVRPARARGVVSTSPRCDGAGAALKGDGGLVALGSVDGGFYERGGDAANVHGTIGVVLATTQNNGLGKGIEDECWEHSKRSVCRDSGRASYME